MLYKYNAGEFYAEGIVLYCQQIVIGITIDACIDMIF